MRPSIYQSVNSIHSLIIELIDQTEQVNGIVDEFLSSRSGYRCRDSSIAQILSEETIIEEKLKCLGFKVLSGIVSDGLVMGKIVGNMLFVRRYDRICAELYYERIDVDEFIRNRKEIRLSLIGE